jgi:hypothetical protein
MYNRPEEEGLREENELKRIQHEVNESDRSPSPDVLLRSLSLDDDEKI